MSRRRKDKKNEDTEARKQRVRSFRSRERRQRRNDATPDASDATWLTRISLHLSCMRILNHKMRGPWPFWLSIESLGKGRNSPTSDYYPCKTIVRGNRVWYAFIFREHRDEQCLLWPDARKELTPSDD